jgi:hypothetical protein
VPGHLKAGWAIELREVLGDHHDHRDTWRRTGHRRLLAASACQAASPGRGWIVVMPDVQTDGAGGQHEQQSGYDQSLRVHDYSKQTRASAILMYRLRGA